MEHVFPFEVSEVCMFKIKILTIMTFVSCQAFAAQHFVPGNHISSPEDVAAAKNVYPPASQEFMDRLNQALYSKPVPAAQSYSLSKIPGLGAPSIPSPPNPLGGAGTPTKPGPYLQKNREEFMAQIKLTHAGKPYVWGADGPHSFDCSGFVSKTLFENACMMPYKRLTSATIVDTMPLKQGPCELGDVIAHKGDPGHTAFFESPTSSYGSSGSKGVDTHGYSTQKSGVSCHANPCFNK